MPDAGDLVRMTNKHGTGRVGTVHRTTQQQGCVVYWHTINFELWHSNHDLTVVVYQ